MKGNEKLSSPLVGFGSNLAPSRPIVADYRVTTMSLREKAFSDRQKNLRNAKIKQLRSAPSFQNRNLDNYPMPYGRADAVRSASGHRQERREKQDNINKARRDSETLADYSKQMFDVAVKTVDKNGVCVSNSRSDVRTKSESVSHVNDVRSNASSRSSLRTDVYTLPSDDVKRNNGPSRGGSILYNARQQVMNAIRIRPHSEPVNIYNHEKNKSKPALIESLHEKNINYTVRPSRSSLYSRAGSVTGSSLAGSTSTSSEFVLIPLNDNYVDKKFSIDLSFSDLNDTLDDAFDEEGENTVFRHSSQPNSRLLPPSSTSGIHLFSLEEESSSESEGEPEVTVQLPVNVKVPPPKVQERNVKKTLEVHNNATTNLAMKRLKIACQKHKIEFQLLAEEDEEGKGPKVPEPEPEVKPVHVKIKLKGPHCWVDDATITSDISEEDSDEIHATDTDHIKATETQQTTEVGKNPLVKRSSQLGLQTHEKKEVQESDNKQIVENDAESDTSIINLSEISQYNLPSFLCPSSERKSREAAIKDWLNHTCFRSGHKAVPIV